MAWTREAIGRVLYEHDIFDDEDKSSGSMVSVRNPAKAIWRHGIVDSLLALQHPAPTRESLDALWKTHDHLFGSAKSWEEEIKDAIMAWAMGQPEKHFWCSHMVYRRREDGWDGTGWVLEAGAGFEVKENWAVCPVCAAPRPKES